MRAFPDRSINLPLVPDKQEKVIPYLRKLSIALGEDSRGRAASQIYGIDEEGAANQVIGADSAGATWEYKTLTAGTGVSITHGTGTITLAGTNTIPYRAITALRTLDTTDCQIECTSGTFTVTLPTAVGITGRMYSIKNTGSGVITVACSGAQTIDGSTTQTLNQWDNMVVLSNNANWIIV